MGNSNKRILDSVHGYIQVSDNLMKNVIDTVYFQRLRRIEQTSTRALFPSARHDCFIHSLGVYHLGHLIIEALKKTEKCESFPSNKEVVFNSYELACLLHDIGKLEIKLNDGLPLLTTHEDEVAQHTTIGYEIIKDKLNLDENWYLPVS